MAKKTGKKFIFSTISTDVEFNAYVKTANDLPAVAARVVIKGGANVPDKRLVTPAGVLTVVEDETFEWLIKDAAFQKFKKNGFISIRDAKVDPEVAAADMESRDKSAPMQPGDFKDGKEPNTNSRKA